MVLPPPSLLSTITPCFHPSESFWASIRPTMSTPPPGAKGTIRRTVRFGKGAAAIAGWLDAKNDAHRNDRNPASNHIAARSLGFYWLTRHRVIPVARAVLLKRAC